MSKEIEKDAEVIEEQLHAQKLWKGLRQTELFFTALTQRREKLLKEAEQLSASHCEEWQMREKLNSARTIRNIIEQYA